MVYYTVMGMKQGISGVAERFAVRYRKGCSGGGAVQEPCEAVLWNCDQNGIHVMALDDAIYRLYPMREMRLVDKVDFWVEGKTES